MTAAVKNAAIILNINGLNVISDNDMPYEALPGCGLPTAGSSGIFVLEASHCKSLSNILPTVPKNALMRTDDCRYN